ncbi:MAG: long-chain fatty acid--CoA ligase, partial [Chitinophagales bacterium]
MVVGGDDKKYVSALIIPSYIQLTAWAKENGITDVSNNALVSNPKVMELFDKETKQLNVNFGQWEQIKKFTLLPNDWTQESGELTPTMKLKRKFIADKYSKEIESLY